MLSVLLQYTDSDYPFGTFKLFLNIICIMFKIIAFSIIMLFVQLYVGLVLYSHVEITCMTASFRERGKA